MERLCKNCGKGLHNKSVKFCNHKCQQEFYYKEYIKLWKDGKKNGLRGKYQTSKYIIRYLFEKYDSKCARCGWSIKNIFTGNIPLEIEHIDGNYLNNNEDNLTLLCPNCHALTETYKGANRGNGRQDRKKYTK